jgi:hypothetical protein
MVHAEWTEYCVWSEIYGDEEQDWDKGEAWRRIFMSKQAIKFVL